MRTLLLATALVLLGTSAPAATLRVVDRSFDFVDDTVLDVDVAVEGAAPVAGLEFSVVYPGDLLAVVEPTTHTGGGFLGAPVVNHDADASGLPAGSRRISVALAAADSSGTDSATVMTISFPLRCSDFSGDWPAGRTVQLQLLDAVAWGIGPDGLPAPLPLDTVDGTFLIDCTTVPVGESGFSTLKARYGREQ